MEITVPPVQSWYDSRVPLITRVLQGQYTYYVVGFAGLLLHLLLARPIYPWYDRLLAWIPLVILLFLLRQYVGQSYKSVPLPVFVAMQIYLFYSVPQFSQEEMVLYAGVYVPTSDALTMAMVLVVVGELLFLSGYHGATRLSIELSTSFYRMNPVPTSRWSVVVLFYSLLGFVIYTLATLRPEYIPLSIRSIAFQLFNVYLGLTLLSYLGHFCSKRWLLILAYLLAAGMVIVGLIQGMLTSMLGPILVLFLTRWIWGKGLEFRWILVAVLAAVIISPMKGEFRSLAWQEKDVASLSDVQARLEKWSIAFNKVWVERDFDEAALLPTASRTSDLLSFAQAIDYVPSIIAHTLGEGIGDALLYWVPRVLWPSKGGSTDLLYTKYAIEFGYLPYEQTKTTAVGASVFTEGYWNFGVYGALGFLFAYGLILGILFGNNGRSEELSMLICIVYLAPQVFILQALAVTVASLFSFMVGITLALWALSVVSRLRI